MQTFSYPSRSSNQSHTVTVTDDNRILCTCRGFQTPNKCWHVREVAAKLNIPTHARSNTPALPFTEANVEQAEGRYVPPSMTPPEGHFAEPMLASALKDGQTIDTFIGKPDWVLEEKYDGHRMLVLVDRFAQATAWARSGIVRVLPGHLCKELSRAAPGLYDGELYIPGGTSTDVTSLSRTSELHLVLFDMLKLYAPEDEGRCDEQGYRSMKNLSLDSRRYLLHSALHYTSGEWVYIAPQYPVTAEALEGIWARGGEGAIVKDCTKTYEEGRRVKHWVKFKKDLSAEIRITGFRGGLFGPHSVVCGVDSEGICVQVKARNDEWRAMFFAEEQTVARDANHPRIGKRLVIAYQNKTTDGKYRHPRADHLLED